MAWVNDFMKTLTRKPKKILVEPEPIFKLDAKCFHAIFEWLPLGELHSFGQTCKQFQQIAGEYFQKTYKNCEIRAESDGIYVCSAQSDSKKSKQQQLDENRLQVNGFIKFVGKIAIHGNRHESNDAIFHFIEANAFESLKHIQLVAVTLTEPKVKCLKKVLKEIEVLKIDSCVVEGKFYHNFLKLCKKNLKRLSVRSGSDANWLLKTYPALEHLELFQVGFNIDKLQTFFDLNPNIKSFAMDINCLWQNEMTLRTVDIRLDDLAIDFHGWEQRMDAIRSLLDKFQKRGLYKRLHLYTSYHDAESFKRIGSIPALEKLYLSNKVAAAIDLPRMIQLKEISFRYFTDIVDMDALRDKLAHLERIHLKEASFYDILPFIQQLDKLQTIHIEHVAFDANFVANLEAVNRERELLQDAHKVTIYIDEMNFLELKRVANVINFSKMEFKRGESCEWNHHFEYDSHSQKSF